MVSSDSYEELAKKLKLIDQQNKQLDDATKILIERDFELRKAYDELEKEKEQVAAERNKFLVALQSISDAVIAVDLEWNIIIFNKAAENLTGYAVEDVLGKPIFSVIKVFENGAQVPYTTYSPKIISGFEGVVFSKPILRICGLNNKESFVQLIAAQITEGSSVKLGSILTLHDITEEQELERMKLDFVSMAAHELRTPLTSIKGYIYIFIRDYLKFMDEKQATILQRMDISAQKLASLVENLLNIARIERGTFTVNLQPADWTALIKGAVSEVMAQVKDKGLELTLDLPPVGLPEVRVDRLRINEVLSNLLTNAINYSVSGGKIKVAVKLQGDEVITQVSDTGQGIPQEALPHLFTKFFRVSGPLEQGSKGTGLGLYIAKSITLMHHGRIWVDSQLNKGSTFSFALPVYREEEK